MLDSRRLPARRTLAAVWLITVTLMAGSLPLRAQNAPAPGADAFAVRDVDVDVTAANAAMARDQAIAEGQRKAFAALYRRLAGPGAPSAPALRETQLAELVQGFEVQREKTSSVRYLGTLTVRFHPGAVRNLLRAANIAFAEPPARPLLVLPVVRRGEALVLWDERTPWREAWDSMAPGNGLVPVAVPFGDLADVADVTAEEAMAGDRSAFENIAGRYGAGDVTVAVFEAPADGLNTKAAATVRLRRFGPDGTPLDQKVSVPAAPGKTALEYARGGVAAVIDRIDDDWRRTALFASGEESRIWATIPIGRLDDWVQTRQRLTQVPQVARAELRSLSRDLAEVELFFHGDAERLQGALAQQELRLTQAGMTGTGSGAFPLSLGRWELRWTGAAAP